MKATDSVLKDLVDEDQAYEVEYTEPTVQQTVTEVITLDDNTINNVPLDISFLSYPLFNKNEHVKINNEVRFIINRNRQREIHIKPLLNHHIPLEFDERVFLAIIKIAYDSKIQKGDKVFPEGIVTSINDIATLLNLTKCGANYNKIRKSLALLEGTSYSFFNSLYSGKEKGSLKSVHNFRFISSLSIFDFTKDQDLNSTIIEQDNGASFKYQICFKEKTSRTLIKFRFNETIIQNINLDKVLMNDFDILIKLPGNARKIYTYTDQRRYFLENDLEFKVKAQILAGIIPLSWNNYTANANTDRKEYQKNYQRMKWSIGAIEKGLKDLINFGLISKFDIINNGKLEHREYILYFIRSRKKIKSSITLSPGHKGNKTTDDEIEDASYEFKAQSLIDEEINKNIDNEVNESTPSELGDLIKNYSISPNNIKYINDSLNNGLQMAKLKEILRSVAARNPTNFNGYLRSMLNLNKTKAEENNKLETQSAQNLEEDTLNAENLEEFAISVISKLENKVKEFGKSLVNFEKLTSQNDMFENDNMLMMKQKSLESTIEKIKNIVKELKKGDEAAFNMIKLTKLLSEKKSIDKLCNVKVKDNIRLIIKYL